MCSGRRLERVRLIGTILLLVSFSSIAIVEGFERVEGVPNEMSGEPSDVGDSYEFDVLGKQYHVLHINFEEHMGIYGSFTVTTGDSITLFVLDDEQYSLFQNYEPHTAYISQQEVANGTILFKPPKTANWHFVFNNRYSNDDKYIHLGLYLDQTAPNIFCNITAGVAYSTSDTARIIIQEARFYIYAQVLLDGVELRDHITESRMVIVDVEFSSVSLGAHTITVNVSDTVGNWNSSSIDFVIGETTSQSQPTRSSSTTSTSNPPGPPNMFAVVLVLGFFVGIPAVVFCVREGYTRFARRRNTETLGRGFSLNAIESSACIQQPTLWPL